MYVISIDPGVHACGCAMWRDGWLIGADWVTNEYKQKPSDLAAAANHTTRAVREWAKSFSPLLLAAVIELPQTYGGRASRGDTNDLISLAHVVGGLQFSVGAAATWLPKPSEWKGQTPKNVTENRVKDALSSVEMSCVKKKNEHVYDAIGIGLWWLKKNKYR